MRLRLRKYLWATILLIGAGAAGYAHDVAAAVPGFEERLGRSIPLDLQFLDEEGTLRRLGDLAGRPTLLVFQYYECGDACGLLLTNLSLALSRISARPGEEYRVLTVSIDEREGPAQAREKKRPTVAVFDPPIPAGAWRFLTGSRESIHRLADAAGFQYRREGDGWIHPLGLVVLSPAGRIVRYIQGDWFLPADLTFSLLEASTGTLGPTISRVARFCFSVDPTGRKLTFNVLRVGGTVTLAAAAALVLFLVVRSRKRHSGGVTP